MRSSALLAALLAAGAVTTPAVSARAQATEGTVALDRFEPAPAGDDTFGVPSPAIGGHLVPRAYVAFDYADKPLRIFGDGEETAIVASQGFLRLDASLALWDRVLVSLDVPFAVVNTGEAPTTPGVTLRPPAGAALGDVRLGVRGRLFGRDRSPFQASVGGYLFAPTGPAGTYTGDGSVRGALHVIAGGDIASRVAWSVNGGVLLRASAEPHLVTFGASVLGRLWDDRITIGPEFYGSIALGDGSIESANPDAVVTVASRAHAEVLFAARIRPVSGLVFGVGGGPGLLTAIGTPTFRVVGLIGWTPRATEDKPGGGQNKPGKGDRDSDGFRDDIDACPDEKGELAGDPSKDGCPPADRDKDSVLDIDDACPNEAGERSGDAGKNGCPTDGDDDGVSDRTDACPKERGEKNADPSKNGCPPDRDEDGVADRLDACPDQKGIIVDDPKQRGCPDDPDGDGVKWPKDACPKEKGTADVDPARSGCPKFVEVKGDELVIGFEFRFVPYGKTRQNSVTPVTKELLVAIRDEITRHPEIELIEIEGHTDDSGDPRFNRNLSEERARAVRQWLVDVGVPADKLTTKGYGHDKPVGDNRVFDGRELNRRVVFRIVKRRKP